MVIVILRVVLCVFVAVATLALVAMTFINFDLSQLWEDENDEEDMGLW